MADKIYYRCLPCHSEPLEFYDTKDEAEYVASQCHQRVGETTPARALNILLDKIRFLSNL